MPDIVKLQHNNIAPEWREGGVGGMVTSVSAAVRIEAGERKIFPFWNCRISQGAVLQFVYDRAANSVYGKPAVTAEARCFQTAVVNPPHTKIHSPIGGWQNAEALAAGEVGIWRQKFADFGDNPLTDAEQQAFYGGYYGSWRVYSGVGGYQAPTETSALTPTGEAYADWPCAAWMVVNPPLGRSGTAHILVN